MTEVVLCEDRDAVATLTLNRPDRLNAWTDELENAYFDALEACGADPDVRAIVVTGAGRGVCAGADMGSLQETGDQGVDLNRVRLPQPLPLTIPKPIVAAINGPVAGIGL